MRIYLIATIMGKWYYTRKYRLLDIDYGEIKEVDRNSLIEAIEKNSWAFKNMQRGEKILIPNTDVQIHH